MLISTEPKCRWTGKWMAASAERMEEQTIACPPSYDSLAGLSRLALRVTIARPQSQDKPFHPKAVVAAAFQAGFPHLRSLAFSV
jgi:hypothetical protein